LVLDIPADLPQWLNTLLQADPIWVHLLIFTLLLIEGIGVPAIPFEPIFIAEGLMITAGKTTLLEAVLWGSVGNWIGNLIGYFLGNKVMRMIPERHRAKMGIEEVRDGLKRLGGLIVITSRWMGLIRTPFILYAKSAGMSFGTYALFSFIGAVTWVGAWQYGSYKLGEVFIDKWHEYAPWIIGFSVILAGSGVWVVIRNNRIRAAKAAALEGSAEGTSVRE
jgi:membrane protein DedA with SNARE-associated domain